MFSRRLWSNRGGRRSCRTLQRRRKWKRKGRSSHQTIWHFLCTFNMGPCACFDSSRLSKRCKAQLQGRKQSWKHREFSRRREWRVHFRSGSPQCLWYVRIRARRPSTPHLSATVCARTDSTSRWAPRRRLARRSDIECQFGCSLYL